MPEIYKPQKDACIRLCYSRHTHILLKIFGIVFIVFIAFAAGRLTVFKYGDLQKPLPAPAASVQKTDDMLSYEKGYQDAMDRIDEVLTDLGIIKEEVLFVDGIVESINDKEIVVAFDEFFLDVFKHGKITKIVTIPPGFLIETQEADKKLTLNDLKVDDVIRVVSKTDIRDTDTFEASSITLASYGPQ